MFESVFWVGIVDAATKFVNVLRRAGDDPNSVPPAMLGEVEPPYLRSAVGWDGAAEDVWFKACQGTP